MRHGAARARGVQAAGDHPRISTVRCSSGRGLLRARRAGQRGTSPGGGQVARCATVRPGLGECRPRVTLDTYHHPAERELTEAEPAGGRRPGGTTLTGGWGAPLAPDLGRPNGSSSSGSGGQYHYPAEQCSRWPSSRGGQGGRAVLDPAGAHLPGQDLYLYPAEQCSRRPSPRGAGGRAVRGHSQWGRVRFPDVCGPAGRPGRSRLARPGPGSRGVVSGREPLGARAAPGLLMFGGGVLLPVCAGSLRPVRVAVGPQGSGRVVIPSHVDRTWFAAHAGAVSGRSG